MQWFVCMDKYWSDQYVQFRKNFCARQSSNLQDAWQSKIVSVSLCHICWMDNFNAFILGCSALRKWRAKRATWSVIAATGGQAPKAPSPPQELGIANPRAARVCIPSLLLKSLFQGHYKTILEHDQCKPWESNCFLSRFEKHFPTLLRNWIWAKHSKGTWVLP